ncbi:MAG: monomeric [FeFe] hydrogenase [Elusimicrobiota bacterium]|jgi:[FeFe] hydrogenase (group B1/B3)|nr:monomeric [FeFe] hydrogenase [Elusimicrobiota bacterium]
MKTIDYSEHFKMEALTEISRMFYSGTIKKDINRIPFNIIPKGSEAAFRCCVHKERAILKLRTLAAFGYSVNEIDEALPISDYVSKDNPEFDHKSSKLLTVMESACSACVKSRFMVSEICQGCLSRKCAANCPFNAVSLKAHKARIDQDLCKNCGKCKEACPYGAILKISVPCEDACPVDAIKKTGKGLAVIDHSLCISCGRCMEACPFGAIMERSQILDVLNLTRGPKPLAAMLAPSIAGQFGVEVGKITTALKELGFTHVYEVALGADITAQNEAHEFKERVIDGGQKFMTTSCCHAYVRLVKKHIPEMEAYISHTRTPMHYTAELIRREIPGALTVFVSPCLSKRKEAQEDPFVDYVITFEELKAMIRGKGINLKECASTQADRKATKEALKFGIRGGVIETVKKAAGESASLIREELITDLDKKTIFKLKAYAKGHCAANLVEVMSCAGGCVGGCATLQPVKEASEEVKKYADACGGDSFEMKL